MGLLWPIQGDTPFAATMGAGVILISILILMAIRQQVREDRRAMATNRHGDAATEEGDSVRLSFPPWLGYIGKFGPWVLLSFVLIYYQLFIPKPATSAEVAAVMVAVDKNGDAIRDVQSTMNDAQRMMHDVALQRNELERALVYLSAQTCLGQSEGPAWRQGCLDAMRGIPPVGIKPVK